MLSGEWDQETHYLVSENSVFSVAILWLVKRSVGMRLIALAKSARSRGSFLQSHPLRSMPDYLE